MLELGVFMFKFSINDIPAVFKNYFTKCSDTHDYLPAYSPIRFSFVFTFNVIWCNLVYCFDGNKAESESKIWIFHQIHIKFPRNKLCKFLISPIYVWQYLLHVLTAVHSKLYPQGCQFRAIAWIHVISLTFPAISGNAFTNATIDFQAFSCKIVENHWHPCIPL